MIDKHPLNYGVYSPALKFVVEMCQSMVVGVLLLPYTNKIGLLPSMEIFILTLCLWLF